MDRLEELLQKIVKDKCDRDLIQQGSRLHRLRPLRLLMLGQLPDGDTAAER